MARVSASPEMISSLSLGIAQNDPSVFSGSSGNVTKGVLPESNHPVKFVAMYDDRTNSHAVTNQGSKGLLLESVP